MRVSILAAALSLALVLAAPVARGESKDEKLLRLYALTGGMKATSQASEGIINRMIPILKTRHPSVPGEVWDIVGSEVRQEFEDSTPMFGAVVLPILKRKFTEDELDDMIAFYDSPTGRKSVELMPQVMQEALAAHLSISMVVAQRANQRVMAKLQELGYIAKP